jgi:anti-sigma factor RsiW
MKRGDIGDTDLHAFVDGELDPPLARDVKHHLDSHSVDAARVDVWRAQNGAIRRAFEPVMREGIPVSLSLKPASRMLRPAEERDAPRIDLRAVRRRRRVISAASTFLAGAAVALLVAFGLPRARQAAIDSVEIGDAASSPAPNATARRARLAWRTFVKEMDRSAERSAAEMEPMMASLSRIAGLTHIPDLGAQQFTFAAVRLMPGEAEPAAFILYMTPDSHRIGFIIERSAEQDLDPSLFDDGGLRCLIWRSGGYSYALVGPAAAETLRAMARATAISLARR